jgi:3-hydroxybutyryl-CoA dehydrogenase
MSTIRNVGVIGAGTMGNGIAQVCAVAGIDAVMIDVAEAPLAKGVASIAGSLERLVKKDKLSVADRDAALARVRTSTDYAALGGLDLVIEAATENPAIKFEILRRADGIARPDAILATNTSSISITQLAAVTKRPDRFLGMHFFNPVPMMALVELIRGLQTSDATVAAADAFAKVLGKTPITVKNSPGFVVNRILCPMLNEAIFVYGEGIAGAKEID